MTPLSNFSEQTGNFPTTAQNTGMSRTQGRQFSRIHASKMDRTMGTFFGKTQDSFLPSNVENSSGIGGTVAGTPFNNSQQRQLATAGEKQRARNSNRQRNQNTRTARGKSQDGQSIAINRRKDASQNAVRTGLVTLPQDDLSLQIRMFSGAAENEHFMDSDKGELVSRQAHYKDSQGFFQSTPEKIETGETGARQTLPGDYQHSPPVDRTFYEVRPSFTEDEPRSF